MRNKYKNTIKNGKMKNLLGNLSLRNGIVVSSLGFVFALYIPVRKFGKVNKLENCQTKVKWRP